MVSIGAINGTHHDKREYSEFYNRGADGGAWLSSVLSGYAIRAAPGNGVSSVMDRIVNFELLRNPYNWIIVILMIAFALMALTYLQPYLGFDIPAGSADNG